MYILNNPFNQGTVTILHPPKILSMHKLKFFIAAQTSSIEQQHLTTSAAAA
jgi:hypothetical protein